MSIPPETLGAIQAAGAALYIADSEFKKIVRDYADRVQALVQANPYDFGNDGLFEDWKTVARLSQAIAQLETDIKKIYISAADFGGSSNAFPTAKAVLHAPSTRSASKRNSEKKAVAKVVAYKKTTDKPKMPSQRGEIPRPLSGNTAKVMKRLLVVLGADDFRKINMTSLAKESGLPIGSIGASISKLIQTGHLLKNGPGSFMLAMPKVL